MKYILTLLTVIYLSSCKEKEVIDMPNVSENESKETQKEYEEPLLSPLEIKYSKAEKELETVSDSNLRKSMIEFGKLQSQIDGYLSEGFGYTCFEFMEQHQENIFTLLKHNDTLVLKQFASGVSGELSIGTENSEQEAEYLTSLNNLLKEITYDQGEVAQYLSGYYLEQLSNNQNH